MRFIDNSLIGLIEFCLENKLYSTHATFHFIIIYLSGAISGYQFGRLEQIEGVPKVLLTTFF